MLVLENGPYGEQGNDKADANERYSDVACA